MACCAHLELSANSDELGERGFGEEGAKSCIQDQRASSSSPLLLSPPTMDALQIFIISLAATFIFFCCVGFYLGWAFCVKLSNEIVPEDGQEDHVDASPGHVDHDSNEVAVDDV